MMTMMIVLVCSLIECVFISSSAEIEHDCTVLRRWRSSHAAAHATLFSSLSFSLAQDIDECRLRAAELADTIHDSRRREERTNPLTDAQN